MNANGTALAACELVLKNTHPCKPSSIAGLADIVKFLGVIGTQRVQCTLDLGIGEYSFQVATLSVDATLIGCILASERYPMHQQKKKKHASHAARLGKADAFLHLAELCHQRRRVMCLCSASERSKLCCLSVLYHLSAL